VNIRIPAALIAFGVFATILTRIPLKMDADDLGFGAAIFEMYRFFTLWTNTLVGLVCVWIARGGRPAQWMTACLVLAIVVVAGVYHVLLAHLNDYTGIDWVIDQMLHTVVPIAFVAFWLLGLPKAQLGVRDMIYFMGYPLIYCIYALGRGALDGVYPYGFINVTNLGAAGVAVNVAGLVVVFALGGLALIGTGRMAARRAR